MKDPLIIFDMDGVLIDVTGSYREVTRQTVILYLSSVIGAKVSRDFITLEDVDAIKKSGGLNNDWDLSYAIINTILHYFFDSQNTESMHLFTEVKSLNTDEKIFERLDSIQVYLNTQDLEIRLGTIEIPEAYFKMRKEAEHSPFLLNHGDVGTGNLAKRIFQELYLGEDLFQKIYAEFPLFYHDQGYINREVLIPSLSQLKKLASCNRLSIATGRPGVEAHYALTQFGLSDIFSSVVTEDDIVNGEKKVKIPLRKPHPYSLELCMERCGYERGDSIYYIGDMPDDMKASLRAGITPIGFVNNSGIKPELMSKNEHCKLLMENGATRVFFLYDDLVAFCT